MGVLGLLLVYYVNSNKDDFCIRFHSQTSNHCHGENRRYILPAVFIGREIETNQIVNNLT